MIKKVAFENQRPEATNPLLSLIMPPPSDHPSLILTLCPGLFYVVQETEVTTDIFRLFNSSSFFSITRTGEEVSIVGEAVESTPARFKEKAVWRCVRVAGPMDFGK
jgi:hypothetical protein